MIWFGHMERELVKPGMMFKKASKDSYQNATCSSGVVLCRNHGAMSELCLEDDRGGDYGIHRGG